MSAKINNEHMGNETNVIPISKRKLIMEKLRNIVPYAIIGTIAGLGVDLSSLNILADTNRINNMPNADIYMTAFLVFTTVLGGIYGHCRSKKYDEKSEIK